uniref:hypothetical protein n=1 Tax=Hassallia byssoidea TaxID=482630 RepID=UPI000584D6F0|nr:hypothetical protein [Hassalia byssoidea]
MGQWAWGMGEPVRWGGSAVRQPPQERFPSNASASPTGDGGLPLPLGLGVSRQFSQVGRAAHETGSPSGASAVGDADSHASGIMGHGAWGPAWASEIRDRFFLFPLPIAHWPMTAGAPRRSDTKTALPPQFPIPQSFFTLIINFLFFFLRI